jgi:Kef-type K+ transport system membrane component KefB/mannitol/fructose-specific phosphotransferase system IIA component (Ntr-type)
VHGMIPTLPITDPVLIFALAMGIFLVAPLLFERLRVPGIIGLIVAGALVGPHVTNLIARDFTIVLLGTVGLLYLVFLAGLELDLNRFREYRRQSVIFGSISFAAPMLLATAVMPLLGFGLPAALLMGAIIGSHTLLAYPIVSRLGLIKNNAVTTVVGGTLMTDSLALAVLAVVAGAVSGEAGPGFWLRLVGFLALYVAVVIWGVPRLGRWFFRRVPAQGAAEFLFLMAVLFASAYLASAAGAQPIIGAFLAGLTLNRLIPNTGPLMNRVRFVGNALFIPFFLLSVGMLVDPAVLVSSAEVWMIAGVITLLVSAGKFAAAWAGGRLFGHSRDEVVLMFGLSVPQAAATLAVTFVGLEIGLFGETVVNAVIIMILITGIIGPSLVERVGRRMALDEGSRPREAGAAPERVLIPISNPATAEALLDLAFAIRDPRSEEPLYPLTVVPEEGSSEERVAEAERLLGHAVIYAAGAEVPVIPLTRVDHNFASGITRGITETRSSTVVIGWDGRRSLGAGIFGSVLDQLLDLNKQQLVVAKLGHPLNTTKRIVLILPAAIDRHPGFEGTLRLLKRVGSVLDSELQVVVVGEEVEHYREVIEEVKPELQTEYESLPDWSSVLAEMARSLRPDDLVAVVSARRGALAWHPVLEHLPGRLAELVPESFVVVYPSEAAPVPSEALHEAGMPPGIAPERVVFDLTGATYERALVHLLRSDLADDASRLGSIVSQLVANERAYSTEIAPGVVVPHARVSGLSQPIIYLGVSPEGIEFPNSRAPAHLVLVLLSPPEQPEAHLRHLADIARFVSHSGRVAKMIEAGSLDELLQAMDAHRDVPATAG